MQDLKEEIVIYFEGSLSPNPTNEDFEVIREDIMEMSNGWVRLGDVSSMISQLSFQELQNINKIIRSDQLNKS